MKQVSFTSPGGFQMDADEISRRQKLAEQLQAESMGPGPQGQMVGGWYVGPSWTQGLAHALKGVQGSYMRDKALKDRQELQGKMSAERSDTLARALAASKGAPASTETIMDETANDGMGQMANINAPAVQADPMKAFGILAGSQDPNLAQAGTSALVSRMMPKNPLDNIAKLDPAHYAPESWAKYIQTGDTTHLRAIASPTAMLNADVNRERLAQKQREWASLSPMQLNQLQQKAAQLGISAQELFFNTGIRVDTPAAPGPTGPGAGPQASSPAPAPAPMPAGPAPVIPAGPRPPQVPTPADFPRQGPNDGKAAQVRVLDSEIAQAQRMVAEATNPQDKAQFQAELDGLMKERARVAPIAAPSALPPKAQVEIDKERIKGMQAMENKRTFNMGGLNDALDTAERILKGRGPTVGGVETKRPKPTQSVLGVGADLAGSLVGIAPNGAAEADELKAIAGSLTAKMPRMEGPQSDKDVQMYREMAGQIGDATIPVSRRLAALEVVRQLYAKYEKPSGQSPAPAAGSAPAGVDPKLWGAMTPEERALWK